ncbi:hypothetical protein CEXT_206541 [Caerostris extrusa]|uniref:Uncharacterized protein n=1 Tax=Caerostris extrusa TaxID=172846 RepID=A0AAV4NHT8_CAEEX|nr:hypothetical protein CEXT_206541 [Caerostris extrusa]
MLIDPLGDNNPHPQLICGKLSGSYNRVATQFMLGQEWQTQLMTKRRCNFNLTKEPETKLTKTRHFAIFRMENIISVCQLHFKKKWNDVDKIVALNITSQGLQFRISYWR